MSDNNADDILLAHLLEQVNSRLDKIDDKMEVYNGHLLKLSETAVKHDENLKEHMLRTKLLEEKVNQVEEEVSPIKQHVHMVNGVIAFITFLGVLFSIYAAIVK